MKLCPSIRIPSMSRLSTSLRNRFLSRKNLESQEPPVPARKSATFDPLFDQLLTVLRMVIADDKFGTHRGQNFGGQCTNNLV